MTKYCACGCGTEVPPTSTWTRGHNAKRGNRDVLASIPDPNPTEFCLCGCGRKTTLATQTSVRAGHVKGKPKRFISGHSSKFHFGPERKQWKGGRFMTPDGYVKVRIGGPGERRYKFEHRVVMEQIIGRPLRDDEQVHHANGIKSDNRPENLELWDRSQPNGCRPVDRVEWAVDLLKRYAPERLADG